MKKENLILVGVIFISILLLIIVFAPKPIKRINPQSQSQPIVVQPQPPQQIVVNSYATAMQAAKAVNKYVLLVFGAEWCDPCKRLKKVLELPKVQIATNDYIVYHIDVDKESKVAQTYGISGIPAYMIIAPTGSVIKTGQNYKDESEFLLWLKSAQ